MSEDRRVIKPVKSRAHEVDNRPSMHGIKANWQLMSGIGGLIRQSGEGVRVTGEGPGRQR